MIRAPASGRLVAIEPRGIGAVIAAGEVLGRVAGEGALRVVAVFPVDRALGRVAVGQRARVRFDSFAWTRYGSVAAVVTGVAGEGSGGGLRVELRPEASGHAVPLQHGLTGLVEVEVERVAPVELVLAALGRAIAGAP
ncbi:MAG: HlyD family efflux transporter periplasmic adaptor subunit [Myxococcales bacterium]|nr:HlyD family efflux transporter periplasmic adaptor subunit [Myxococcales bacterium]